jgi:cyclopropane-fatty-acyl-phospholipid synthase
MIEHVCTPRQARAGESVARYRDFFRRAWEWSRPNAVGFRCLTGCG